jgi:hypothetical protein
MTDRVSEMSRQSVAASTLQEGNDADSLWPTILVVALIVTIVTGLFVFVGSLPAIHERQKNEAIRNRTLRQ